MDQFREQIAALDRAESELLVAQQQQVAANRDRFLLAVAAMLISCGVLALFALASVRASEVLAAVVDGTAAGLPPGETIKIDCDVAPLEINARDINARDAVSLGVLTSEPRRAQGRRHCFVFATAYADDDRLFPEPLRAAPRLAKPVLPNMLLAQLQRLLDKEP